VNKIVVLSHLGFDADRMLASRIHGVDVIVGGHSHTLLGSYPSVGLRGMEQYPTVARDAQGASVLIVQAWRWASQIGSLRISFDVQGKVTGYGARPVFVANAGFAQIYDLPNARGEKKRVQFTERGGKLEIAEYDGTRYSIEVTDDPRDPADQYDAYAADYRKLEARLSADPNVAWVAPDPAGLAKLASYSGGILSFKNKVVATVTEDMRRGHNRGPGPIIADAMTWRTGAQVGMVNPGGVRVDLAPGDLTLARVYELQPFGDTLITVNVTGEELRRVLEDAADFTISSYGTRAGTHLLYVSGVILSLDTRAAKGKRVSDVRVKEAGGAYAPLTPLGTYSLVVNSFMAGGGDRNSTLAGLAGKYDTGHIDAEAFADYVGGKRLANVAEERVRIVR
jgi:5'-nucleotidase / UDP-sugar diphosphatase